MIHALRFELQSRASKKDLKTSSMGIWITKVRSNNKRGKSWLLPSESDVELEVKSGERRLFAPSHFPGGGHAQNIYQH